MKGPKFNPLGNLPEKIYPCDVDTLHSWFVAAFPASTEREVIFQGYCKLRQTVVGLGVNATQWINGSFTTRKIDPDNPSQELEPDDIDVITFIDYDVLNSLPAMGQQAVLSFINGGDATKKNYRTHSIMVISCSPGHKYSSTFERNRRHYRDIFSRHSPPSKRTPDDLLLAYPARGPRKGFVSITIGDPTLAPLIDDRRI